MKIIAAIQARMGSTRFPGKVMADLCGRPVLGWVIDQAKKIECDDVFLLHPVGENELEIFANQNNIIPFSRDSEEGNYLIELECLYWYYCVARSTKADYIIRICGDSPFIDPWFANNSILKIHSAIEHNKEPDDYYGCTIVGNYVLGILTLYGVFVEIFSAKRLIEMFEHTTIPFYYHYMRSYIPVKMPYNYKLSIDVPKDLERARKVIKLAGGKIPGYKQINDIMRKHPELQHKGECIQKYEWLY